MSTIRSRITGNPGNGFKTTVSGSVRMLVRHASPFLPLMFIASEPQMPSRHERRKLKLGSIDFSRISVSSSMRSLPSDSDLQGLHPRLEIQVRVIAVNVKRAHHDGLFFSGHTG